MISLCCTVTNRQDLLSGMLRSAFAGSVQPDHVYIVDQRYPSVQSADLAFVPMEVPITIVDLEEKRGCEASAVNWYLEHVPEDRIIAHEDVRFGLHSIETFRQATCLWDFVIDSSQGVMTYSDKCRSLAGLYDVTISPNYFHFVDVDYEDRLAMSDVHPVVIDCGIEHLINGTMKAFTHDQKVEHFVRDETARLNYEAKWGRQVTPGGDTIGRARWRQENDISGWRHS